MKRFIPCIIVAVFLLALTHPARGALEYYGIEDTINDDLTVRNVITLKFNETIPHLDYTMNYEVTNLNVESDFPSADCAVTQGNVISCDFVGMSREKNQLRLSFDTTGGVKKAGGKFEFRATYGFIPTERTFVLIRLPQYSVLSEDVTTNSFLPANGTIISDGKTIAVFWEFAHVGKENLQFAVSYRKPSRIPSELVIALTILVIVAMAGLVVYARKRHHPVEMVTAVLNHDEKRVVDILKQHEGRALQKIIVKDGDFSKAKVSRLVKDMKERNIVDIEPVSGRENRIILTMGKKKHEQTELSQKPEENTTND